MPSFQLKITPQAKKEIETVLSDPSKKGLHKQLKKALGFLKANPKHPGLNSHPFGEVEGVKVWTSYVQNNTPSAHRVLWQYGTEKNTIIILNVVPHY